MSEVVPRTGGDFRASDNVPALMKKRFTVLGPIIKQFHLRQLRESSGVAVRREIAGEKFWIGFDCGHIFFGHI